MGRLRTIDITSVQAIKTDDFLEDEVYYISFVNCDDGGMSGNSPGSYVPMNGKTITKDTRGSPLSCRQGVPRSPYTAWARLFPVHSDHELCCEKPQEGVVSGPIFFFDKDSDSFATAFGVVVIVIVSLGLAAAVTLVLAPTPAVAIPVGTAIGLASGAGLTFIWRRIVRVITGDNYLGGIRIEFPCYSDLPIEQTHTLQGARNGIRSDTLPGGRGLSRWLRSSARYNVSFRANYS